MKYLLPLAAVTSVVLGDAGYVQLPVSVEKTKAGSTRHRRSVDDTIQNGVTQYFVDIEIGTPGQPQKVAIDTGSSDLWVFAPNTDSLYTYDPSQSSTSQELNDTFAIGYADQTSATGNYYTDDTSLGGTKVNFEFAVVTNAPDIEYGVFGIGDANFESSGTGYANYPNALQEQNITQSAAFSLYLNDINATTGSLLFGGVDTSKYSGQLYIIPIPFSNDAVQFEVEGRSLDGVLDSGTSYTYLPDDLVQALAKKFNASWNASAGFYLADQRPSDGLTYSFSGANITVSPSELFTDYGGSHALTILPYSLVSDNIVLGESFLRSAYVVFDYNNYRVAIAQADYNGTGPILPITSAGIPGAKPAPNPAPIS